MLERRSPCARKTMWVSGRTLSRRPRPGPTVCTMVPVSAMPNAAAGRGDGNRGQPVQLDGAGGQRDGKPDPPLVVVAEDQVGSGERLGQAQPVGQAVLGEDLLFFPEDLGMPGLLQDLGEHLRRVPVPGIQEHAADRLQFPAEDVHRILEPGRPRISGRQGSRWFYPASRTNLLQDPRPAHFPSLFSARNCSRKLFFRKRRKIPVPVPPAEGGHRHPHPSLPHEVGLDPAHQVAQESIPLGRAHGPGPELHGPGLQRQMPGQALTAPLDPLPQLQQDVWNLDLHRTGLVAGAAERGCEGVLGRRLRRGQLGSQYGSDGPLIGGAVGVSARSAGTPGRRSGRRRNGCMPTSASTPGRPGSGSGRCPPAPGRIPGGRPTLPPAGDR